MTTSTFDPRTSISTIKGQDYLEVKWRLVWLRTEHPDAVIETELVSHDGRQAIFRAAVSIPGGGRATGFGSEVAEAFENYIEKAETKAIGRALAAVGFGTQFCTDFTDADDAPQREFRPGGPRPIPAAPMATSAFTDVMTSPQRAKIARLAGTLQLSRDQLAEIVSSVSGKTLDGMSKRDASRVIDSLTERLPAPISQRAS